MATALPVPGGPTNWLVTTGYAQIQIGDVNGDNPVDLEPRVVLRFSAAYLVEDRVLTTIGGVPVFATLVRPNPGILTGDWNADPIDVMARALAALRDAGYFDLTGVANFPY